MMGAMMTQQNATVMRLGDDNDTLWCNFIF